MASRADVASLSTCAAVITAAFTVCFSVEARAGTGDQAGVARRWPNVMIVHSPLREVIENMWDRSATFRQTCHELAEARAVVHFKWDAGAGQSRAKTDMQRRDGVVVAIVSVPTGPDIVELVAHELQHVIENARGLDYKAEADRRGSGVWRTEGRLERYETQAAIDAGRQVAKEVRDTQGYVTSNSRSPTRAAEQRATRGRRRSTDPAR
jgi:hypothetical protein